MRSVINVSIQLVLCYVLLAGACRRVTNNEHRDAKGWGHDKLTERPDRLYRSRRVLLEDGTLQDAAIAVDVTGRISGIITGEEAQRYADKHKVELLDFGTYTIMPGVIDSHVHVNEPGRTDWEGYESATRAAAWGGITTIADMPLNSIPPTTTVANLQTKIAAALGKTHVDVALWGGVIPGNEEELIPLIEAGVRGFKCFTGPSGVDEFPMVTRPDIEKALKKLQGTGSVLLFHAENPDNVTGVDLSHPEEYKTYLETKPPVMEVDAIKMITELVEQYNVRCHIVHLSASEALPDIRAARAKHLPLSVETCHHYLTLDAEQVPDNHTEYKCSPPIRWHKNQDALWKALEAGDIDMVVSDHSPSTAQLKGLCCGETPDFLKAWGGIASVQFGLSLLWTGAYKRDLPLSSVSHWLSTKPAQLLGLSNDKGSLRAGLHADLVIWDPEEEWTVTEDLIQFKNKITPYLGMQLRGKVLATVVRGKIVYRSGQPFGQALGKLLL